jgi:hypothetical protein
VPGFESAKPSPRAERSNDVTAEAGGRARGGAARIHTGPEAEQFAASEGARAVTSGADIYFGAGEYRPGTAVGDLLIAHELAHVQQQTDVSAPPVAEPEAERQADQAAAASVFGGRGPSLRRGGLALRSCNGNTRAPSPPATRALEAARTGAPISPADAVAALDDWRGLSAADRDRLVDAYAAGTPISVLLRALPPAELEGAHAPEIQDILRRLQEHETRRASGQTDAQMATRQGQFEHARDVAAAQAAAAAPPTPAQVHQAHEQAARQGAIWHAPAPVNFFLALPIPQQTQWQQRAAAIIPPVVAFANAHHPELGLVAADLVPAFAEINDTGANALSIGGNVGGRRVCKFGMAFVQLAEQDPGYVMELVVHEIHGHPMYGGSQSTYPFALERQARTAQGLPAPTADETTQMGRTYGYEDTEMYSIVRGAHYYHAPTAAHIQAVPVGGALEPVAWLRTHIRTMRDVQWEPSLAKAILTGFWRRISSDPRVDADGLNAFRSAVNAEWPAAAKDILQ